ncbi:hypothetical protein BDV93DRAFT_543069 [Ceratobasidium sp. AG-I]|nr:hypothetical protein BDV93DRAFT_543069 [Ceratobasidium sp. AG-I]
MQHTGLSRRPPNNQPRVGSKTESHRSRPHSVHGAPSGQPMFHVLPPDSYPHQPHSSLSDPYQHDGGHRGHLPPSPYVSAPMTSSSSRDRSPYSDYRDPANDFYSDSEPSSDSDNHLTVPTQGFHKRSYSNETRGRPVRSHTKMAEPRSRSTDVTQPPAVHKPRHRKKHRLRSALKEGPSPRMEVAFLPDVTVVEFEVDDPRRATAVPEPYVPQHHQQPQQHQQHPQQHKQHKRPDAPTHDTETVEVIVRERVRYRSYKSSSPTSPTQYQY